MITQHNTKPLGHIKSSTKMEISICKQINDLMMQPKILERQHQKDPKPKIQEEITKLIE